MEFNLTFLEDEIREGFYVPAIMKQLWATQLNVLASFDKVCQKYDIPYFADWGTLLGCVRHHGYVPWDDDLDVTMLRENYVKLTEIYEQHPEEFPEGIIIQNFRNRDDYVQFHSMALNKGRICYEPEHLAKYYGFPYEAGFDIFVLDRRSDDIEEQKKMAADAKLCLAIADQIGDGKLDDKASRNLNIEKIEAMVSHKIERFNDNIMQRRELYKAMEEICSRFMHTGGDTVNQNVQWGLIHPEIAFKRDWYQNQVYLPFEYIKMPVPSGYEEMLKYKYGDYMVVRKNRSAHNYPYFAAEKEAFEATLDFELPHFEYDEKVTEAILAERENTKAQSWKATIEEAVANLDALRDEIVSLCSEIAGFCDLTETVLAALADSQQLAVDIGNFLEFVWGEEKVSDVVAALSDYCEKIFALHQAISVGKTEISIDKNAKERDDCSSNDEGYVKQKLDELQHSYDNLTKQLALLTNRKEILFIPVRENDWEQMEKYVVKACEKVANNQEENKKGEDNNKSLLINIMSIPYHHKAYDGSFLDTVYNDERWQLRIDELKSKLAKLSACELDSLNGNWSVSINAINYTDYDLLLHHPDEIYIQFPYDEHNPVMAVDEDFYSMNLACCTDKLIYTPWFETDEFVKEDEIDYLNMQYYCDMPAVFYADETILPSDNMKNLYIEKIRDIYSSRRDSAEVERIVSRLKKQIVSD